MYLGWPKRPTELVLQSQEVNIKIKLKKIEGKKISRNKIKIFLNTNRKRDENVPI